LPSTAKSKKVCWRHPLNGSRNSLIDIDESKCVRKNKPEIILEKAREHWLWLVP
jgi:hypothetical protein